MTADEQALDRRVRRDLRWERDRRMTMEITNQEARYLLRLIAEDMMRMDNLTVGVARQRAATILHVKPDSPAGPSIDAVQSLARGIAARLHGVAPEGV